MSALRDMIVSKIPANATISDLLALADAYAEAAQHVREVARERRDPFDAALDDVAARRAPLVQLVNPDRAKGKFVVDGVKADGSIAIENGNVVLRFPCGGRPWVARGLVDRIITAAHRRGEA